MKTLASVLGLLISTVVYSQLKSEIDSLKKEFRHDQATPHWKSSDIAARLGWLYNYDHQYDSSLRYYKYAIKLAPVNSKDAWLGNIHLGIGSSFSALDRWDSALYYCMKSLKHFKNINDVENISLVNSHIAVHFYYTDLYEEALTYALAELSFLEAAAQSPNLAYRYDLIGLINQNIGDYVFANQYHRKALAIRLNLDQPLEVAKSYNNLGELFILTQQYDSAKRNLLLSANLKRKLNDTQGLARTLSRLGKAFMLTGETVKAKTQLLASLKTQRQINDEIGMIETLNTLGELYQATNQLSESNKTLLEASAIIYATGTPDYLRQNLELRIALARKQKDFATGMDLQDALLIIRDSLLNEEKSKSLQAMQIRYETKKKEQEIALLEQREEINQAKIDGNRFLIGALITGLTLVAAIGLLVYANLKSAKAAKQRIELLLSETRHRMKNHLQTLASIFHLQTRHYTNHEMILEAKSSESRVHTMSLLHDKFFTNEIDQVINTRDYITDLVNKLVGIYGSQTKNLNLSLDIEDVELDIDKAFALSLIIQELVCNAFKYAFDHEPNPGLMIDIHQRNDSVHAMIHDNGIGFSGNTFETSQGLNLVNALVYQLDGEIHIDNNRGTTFMIRFPVTSLWKKHVFS